MTVPFAAIFKLPKESITNDACVLDKLISDRISSDRDLGLSYKSIAEKLNSDGVKTVLGGVKWYPSTVRHIYLRK